MPDYWAGYPASGNQKQIRPTLKITIIRPHLAVHVHEGHPLGPPDAAGRGHAKKGGKIRIPTRLQDLFVHLAVHQLAVFKQLKQ